MKLVYSLYVLASTGDGDLGDRSEGEKAVLGVYVYHIKSKFQ